MNLFSMFKTKPDVSAAMQCGHDVKRTLMAVEAAVADGDIKRAGIALKRHHKALESAATEVGRLMQVDVTPLSGGLPKPD